MVGLHRTQLSPLLDLPASRQQNQYRGRRHDVRASWVPTESHHDRVAILLLLIPGQESASFEYMFGRLDDDYVPDCEQSLIPCVLLRDRLPK